VIYIRDRVLSGEVLAGTWCNLGSSISAEIIAQAGFDWMLIDVEHGFGDYESLVHQLQAVTGTHTPSARSTSGLRESWSPMSTLPRKPAEPSHQCGIRRRESGVWRN